MNICIVTKGQNGYTEHYREVNHMPISRMVEIYLKLYGERLLSVLDTETGAVYYGENLFKEEKINYDD